jgi:beta-glucosidase
VQLYVKDDVSSVVVPIKQLRKFQRINLKVGEEKKVSFILTAKDFSLFDANYRKIAEKGSFQLLIGGDSEHVKLKEKVVLNHSYLIK